MDDPQRAESVESGQDEIYQIKSEFNGTQDSESPNRQINPDEITSPPAEFIQRELSDSFVTLPSTGRDLRLYLPKHAGWVAVIKQSWEQEHCYAKNPGEDWFHLLANGEIYVQRGAEKYCLTCALRQKILTRNRLFWQKGAKEPAEDDTIRGQE